MTSLLNKSLISALLATGLFLSGCATISDLNPFGGDGPDQGEIPEEDERLTILSLSESLQIADPSELPAVVLPDPYVNLDWRQTGGNQFHAMQHTQASGSLSKAWSRGIGKGSSTTGRVTASPVVAGDLIFALDGHNKLSAVNAQSGAKVWDVTIKVNSEGKSRIGKASTLERLSRPFTFISNDRGGVDTEAVGGGVAFDGGALYVSSGYGMLLKLDPATGEEIWRQPTRTPLHSAPAVSNGRVFAISDDNEVFAFNADSGEVIWTHQGIIEQARMMTSPSPAVVDDVVLVPYSSGELVALRVQNGGVLWQDSLSSAGKLTPLSSLNDIASGPVVADGYVFVTAQSGVISAFDLRTGQRIWSQPAGSLGFPWVAGEFLYLVTTDSNVVCFSRADGKVVWMTQLDVYESKRKQEGRIAWTGPVMAGGRLYVASSHERSVTLNPITGEILSEEKIGDPVFVNPIIANETIYLLTDDATLIALR